ncbi:hypothetical protein [Parafrankia elaeagni]|uniref:hypothetical protein n=1 Tax=Parafrankia elaeagni TaxID=222534 RepID=UPI0004779F67|nr:hypothetical protein [Parafrankia elaeagni]
MTTRHTDSGLLGRLSPRLYRQNAFRVTGLPLAATGRDIRRKSDMLAVIEKTGGELPVSDVLPLRPAPSAQDLRGALDRLGDPRQRLVDEFFWFWPVATSGTGGEPDPTLAALATGDTASAVRHWSTAAARTDPEASAEAASAVHNLAVLEHLQALDAEQAATDTSGPPPDWLSVHRRWENVLDDDRVWEGLAARIRQAGNARLDESLAADVRAALPTALLAIGAELAVAALTAGDLGRAERQLAAMRAARLGPTADEALGAALRTAGTPWANEVTTLCDSAVRIAENTSTDGLAQAERILTESAELLERIDVLLPAEEPTRVRAHDKVALETLHCLLAFDRTRGVPRAAGDNAARDHLTMTELLTRAERTAGSEAIRERLAENRALLESSALHIVCWVCRDRPAEERSGVRVWMHGEVVRTFQGVQWSKGEITVPRCRTCELRRASGGWRMALRTVLYFLVAISVPSMLFPGAGGGFVALGVLAAVIAFLVDGMAVSWPAARRERARIDSFPPLADLRGKGWQRGERPLGVTGG